MTLEATPAPQTAPALDAGSLATVKPARSIAARATVAWPWVGLGAMTLAGVLLFWSFEAMPFMDLPAHAGLIALRHRLAASPF